MLIEEVKSPNQVEEVVIDKEGWNPLNLVNDLPTIKYRRNRSKPE